MGPRVINLLADRGFSVVCELASSRMDSVASDTIVDPPESYGQPHVRSRE